MQLHFRLEMTGESATLDIEGDETINELKTEAARQLGVSGLVLGVVVEGEKIAGDVRVSLAAVCDGDEVILTGGKQVAARVHLEAVGVQHPTKDTLQKAIHKSDVNLVASILDSECVTPGIGCLLDACHMKNLEIVKKIVEYAPIQVTSRTYGMYPVHAAAIDGSLEIVQFLIECDRGTVKQADEDKSTALMVACQYGMEDVCGYLVGVEGVELDKVNRLGRSALLLACLGVSEGHGRCVEILLRKKNNEIAVNTELRTYMNEFRTPLTCAARGGLYPACVALVGCGADVVAKDSTWKTPLHYAAENGHVEVCRVLLEGGADVDALDMARVTPLNLAFQNDFSEVASLLVTVYKASMEMKLPETRRTPLHCAALLGSPSVVRSILQTTPPTTLSTLTSTTDSTHCTPLLLSISNMHYATTRLLLDPEAFPPYHVPDDQGMTCLHHAARHGATHLAQELLQKGANPNVRDNNKKTPLYYAGQGKHVELEEMLMRFRKF